jgi:hypothetical protein
LLKAEFVLLVDELNLVYKLMSADLVSLE